jgi:hypothetical protein
MSPALGLFSGWPLPGPGFRAPAPAFGLRNPDLYLAGERVEMVSTAEAFADQVPGMTAAAVLAVPFFAGFLSAADRIGFWLGCTDPPGDTAPGVAARIAAFAGSLRDHETPETVFGVTYSPVLRAVARRCTGEDPGEPAYLRGYAVDVDRGRLAITGWP